MLAQCWLNTGSILAEYWLNAGPNTGHRRRLRSGNGPSLSQHCVSAEIRPVVTRVGGSEGDVTQRKGSS